jgi:hypothetical protein
MPKIVNRYNFFKEIKVDQDGYVEVIIEDYIPPDEKGRDQYKTFKTIKLDDEGRLIITTNNI